MADFSEQETASLKAILQESYDMAQSSYETLLSLGAARELARLCVPVGNYSMMYAAANVRNWYQFWQLRADEAAQWEIRQFAFAIADIIESIIPETWKALTMYKPVDLTTEQIEKLLKYMELVRSGITAAGDPLPRDEDEIIQTLQRALRHGTVKN